MWKALGDRETTAERGCEVPEVVNMVRGSSGGPIGLDSLGNPDGEWCGRTRETPRSLVSLLESLIYPFCLIVSWESSRPDDHASMEARETAWADFTTRADLHVKPQWLEVSWLLWEMTGPGGVI